MRHGLVSVLIITLRESHLRHLLVIHREILLVIQILNSWFMTLATFDDLLDTSWERSLDQSLLLLLLRVDKLLRLFGRLLLRIQLLRRGLRSKFLLHLLLVSLLTSTWMQLIQRLHLGDSSLSVLASRWSSSLTIHLSLWSLMHLWAQRLLLRRLLNTRVATTLVLGRFKRAFYFFHTWLISKSSWIDLVDTMLLSILILQIVVRSPYYTSIFLFTTLIRQDILIHQKVYSAKLVLRNIIVSTHGSSMFITFNI